MASPRTFRFGFLLTDCSFKFNGGSIEPLPDFDKRLAAVLPLENPDDGFAYPDMVQRTRWPVGREDLKEKIAGTRRPEHLWKLPASHVLRLSSRSKRDLEREDAWFLINLLAYLFGVRLTLEGWSFDGRVPLRLYRTCGMAFVSSTAAHFVSHSYRTWRGWPKRTRHLFSTLLYNHSRVASYEWDWEQFREQYTVLDALWRVAEDSGLAVCPRRPGRGDKRDGSLHWRRLHGLGKAFGVRRPRNLGRRIVRLRNELIHEGLWDGEPPGTGAPRGHKDASDLRRLTQRVIPAVLGYRADFVRTPWWYFDVFGFDPPS